MVSVLFLNTLDNLIRFESYHLGLLPDLGKVVTEPKYLYLYAVVSNDDSGLHLVRIGPLSLWNGVPKALTSTLLKICGLY